MEDVHGGLALTVKEGQAFQIGDAFVLVKKVGGNGTGNSVRLKIIAPQKLKITRNITKLPTKEEMGKK